MSFRSPKLLKAAKDQACGNCKEFIEVRKASRNIPAGGKCIWHPPFTRTYVLPDWVKKAETYVSATDGKECEAWTRK